MKLRKPKILVVGSFMMDLIAMTFKAPSPGETVLGEAFRTAPGGKGANQAVQCALLGADVTMVGKVGNDTFGKVMKDTVKAAGVNISHVSVDPEISSGVGHILLECKDGRTENRITVIPGANHTIKGDEIEWLKKEIKQYDMVLLQLEIPMDINIKVAAYAKAAGVPVMLNPAPIAPLPDELLSCITYLSPNEHEAKLMCEFEKNRVKYVITTLGEKGAKISDGNEEISIPCVKIETVVDPTAAGDSFVAAFCIGVCVGMSHLQAIKFATYVAAITVSKMGAMPSLPNAEEVMKLMIERKESKILLEFIESMMEVEK